MNIKKVRTTKKMKNNQEIAYICIAMIILFGMIFSINKLENSYFVVEKDIKVKIDWDIEGCKLSNHEINYTETCGSRIAKTIIQKFK